MVGEQTGADANYAAQLAQPGIAADVRRHEQLGESRSWRAVVLRTGINVEASVRVEQYRGIDREGRPEVLPEVEEAK